MASHLRTELVLDALNMALWQRQPHAVIHHSDQGSQYTSLAFGFATLECELIDRRRFRSQAEARMAVFTFIEGWYNPRRRHSALGYLSPLEYERRTQLSA